MPGPAIARSLTLVSVVLIVASARAEWINRTEEVPVARLVKNMTARLAADPRDSEAHYVLARVHSMAWSQGTETVTIEPPEEEGAPPTFAPWQTVRLAREPRKGADVTPPDSAAIAHFHQSVAHYRRATELDGKTAVHFLGLGYMLQDGARYVQWLRTPDGVESETTLPADEIARYESQVTELSGDAEGARARARRNLIDALPKSATVLRRHLRTENAIERPAVVDLLRYHWESLSAAAYRRAHELALPADLAADSHGEMGDSPVSQEAGEGLLAILETRVDQDALREEITALTATLARLAAMPRWETPIVFPLCDERPLCELIDATHVVHFDLVGDGVREIWPWVGRDVGLLVWDPDGDGDVSSGRDLFGGRTWWIRWPDGYAPLAALDDDQNGRLTGAELAGLAVWVDADADATSDPGEVTSAISRGIVAISVRSDHRHAGVPASSAGITYEDGATVPTYDWTPQRVVLRERLAE